MILQVDPDRCKRCEKCDLQVGCFGQVVDRPQPKGVPIIDEAKCYGCGVCTMICRFDAVVEKHLVD